MKDLAKEIEITSIADGCAAIWWLGQAGFAFKSSGGAVIYLDPYLTDMVHRVAGFKRLSLAPIDIEDVRADWFVCSHEHPDHCDTDALPTIAADNPGCTFLGSQGCAEYFEACGIPSARLLIMEPGNTYELGSTKLYTARADHGELSPSALALLFDFGRVKVLFTGDTCLNVQFLQPLLDMEPDMIVACINGSFGNMNADQAARLSSESGARLAVPCHYWMFKEHHVEQGGDPHTFCEACARLCPDVDVRLLTPGECLIIKPES